MKQSSLSYNKNSNDQVECLGLKFENDEKRLDYFREKLREKLKDPEFRKIEGFPIGSDEDILAISDPPFYTACPNPFIDDFVKLHSNNYLSSEVYKREPFASDVSEGKYDPLYKIHSYPTKVPFRAIMKYILHFTNPGDLVFDGFCGTGMTGVAALMCDSKEEFDQVAKNIEEFKIGARKSILCDISTNATHISSNYNRHIDTSKLSNYFDQFLDKCESKLGWVYKTKDVTSKKEAEINYVVWSEVFICEHCSSEYTYWESSVTYNPNDSIGKVIDKHICPKCGADGSRRGANNAVVTIYDSILGKSIVQKKHKPVLINYRLGTKRLEKYPDEDDLNLLVKIDKELSSVSSLVKTKVLMHKNDTEWGDLQRDYHLGISHSHHFFSIRNLYVIAIMSSELSLIPEPYRDSIRFMITASFNRITNLVRYMPQYKERNVGPLSGTLYKPMLFGEINIFNVIKSKMNRAIEGLSKLPNKRLCTITTQSSGNLQTQLLDNCIDYIFTDPPFGDNLPYSELNFNEESWLGVQTNNKPEAIVSGIQHKELKEYQRLISNSFKENYRILKPGRWITIVFHNSQNKVWNSIQEALLEAGFIVADVRTLDKQRGTTKQQVYTSGAVKQDLVISAYKPTETFINKFALSAGTIEGVWDFVQTHLQQLPNFVAADDGSAEIIAERQNYLIFDRMVAFHVLRGVSVPLSATEFYAGLSQRFAERDGMYFLSDQVADYDKKRVTIKEIKQLELFVVDESSAIQWIKQQLAQKPMTFQDIQPLFLREISGWHKYEKPLELTEILKQNYLQYDGIGDVPSQIHSYLSTNFKDLRNLPKDSPLLKAKAKDRWYVPDPNKAQDLEKLRERALMKEFDEYRSFSGRKIKTFRLEAIRAGFKKAWSEKDYQTIISVAMKVPDNVLQEDPKLTMWYDGAMTRMGD